MTFDELPEKIRTFFSQIIKRKHIFIEEFNENIKYGYSIMDAIEFSAIIADDIDIIYPPDIEQELFCLIFGIEE